MMWVKINIMETKYKVVYLPKFIGEKMSESADVHFGKRMSRANIKINFNENSRDNSYEKPYDIQISKELSDELLIQHNLTYQIKISYDYIEFGPIIGLLLGNHCHDYSPLYMEKYSHRLKIHDKIGGLVCAFSPKAIDFRKLSAYGLYYDVEESKWKYAELPLPNVIYRRGFHGDERIIWKLNKLTQGKVFNSTRFTKYELYEYINKNEELKKYQPPTELIKNYEMAKEFIDKYKNVILKPVNLSRGRGICLIEKSDKAYNVKDYRSKKGSKIELENDEELKKFFSNNNKFFKDYIIQKKLNLSNINKSVFDIRVVMQKINKNTWQCSGMECRISKENTLITNISKGGYPLSVQEALRFKFPEIEKRKIMINIIKLLGFKLCLYLDKLDEHFAELGIDIALDEDNKLWIIEANVLPGFDGFKTLNSKVYSNIKYTPLLYATSLEGFNIEELI